MAQSIVLVGIAIIVGLARSGQAADIVIGSATGEPGHRVTFVVTLNLRGQGMFQFQNTIAFSPGAPIRVAPTSGGAACRFVGGTTIFYGGGFGFRPLGCVANATCTQMFFLGLPIGPDPPDGSPIYSCDVDIPLTTAPGDYPLGCVEQSVLDDFDTSRVVNLGCTPGTIRVVECVGDCDGNGAVTVDEVMKGVNIALGQVESDSCRAFGTSDSVTIAQLLLAVNNALKGCGG